MDVYFIIVQAIGFLAFGLSLLSVQFQSQKTMFGIRITGDILWSLHYFLLSAFNPALTVFIAAIRTFLSIFICPKYKTAIIGSAIVAVCFLCHVNAHGEWENYLPAVTAVIFGLCNYYHENYWRSRLLMMLGLSVWIVVGIVFQSYAEIVSSTFGVISILIGFYRHKTIDKSE